LFSLMLSFNSYGGSFIDFSLSDFCYQQPDVQDRGGVYYFPNESVGITASSLCVYKDLYGQYMSKVELLNGQFDGQFIRWWENGQKHQEKHYKDGNLNGKSTDWWSDGTIYLEKNYKDGTLEGKQFEWYKNGQIKSEATYKDAKPEGEHIYWYDNGQKIRHTNYKDGKTHGKWTSWYENGQLQGELNYKDGKSDGKWTWFSKNGVKVWDRNCISGECTDCFSAECTDNESSSLKYISEEIKTELKVRWVNSIAAKVKANWRYQSAESHWTAEVYVIQDRDGNVKAVDVRNDNVGDSDRAKSFMNSIERAVYKASPLPGAPDDAVFDSEIYMLFSVK